LWKGATLARVSYPLGADGGEIAKNAACLATAISSTTLLIAVPLSARIGPAGCDVLTRQADVGEEMIIHLQEIVDVSDDAALFPPPGDPPHNWSDQGPAP
jgi:hypothetical protein